MLKVTVLELGTTPLAGTVTVLTVTAPVVHVVFV